MTPDQLKQQLSNLNIQFQEYNHPALHTCNDADYLKIERPGTRLKNLFLRDNYGRRHFLLITASDRAVDLKKLTKQLKVSRLGFASEERLQKHLGVKPGCVSFLALMNDTEQAVELLVDSAIWNSDLFHCHPLVNTETLVIPKPGIEKLLEFTGHSAFITMIPDKRDSD